MNTTPTPTIQDDDPAGTLASALVAKDPTSKLWELVDSGWTDDHLPELPQLRLEQDPIHQIGRAHV